MRRERIAVTVDSAAFREAMRRVEEKKANSKLRKRINQPERSFSPVVQDLVWDNMWLGRRCFIVGGGPSLKGFDFSKLDGELIIAINAAYKDVDADIIFGMDKRFFEWAGNGYYGETALEKWENTKALKIRLVMDSFEHGNMIKIGSLGREGLSNSVNHGLYHGNNSGYGALNLALCLGANPIYLLGYDMNNGNRGHYHDGHPVSIGNMASFPTTFNNYKNKILSKARVINCNRNSMLKCFEFGDIPKIRNPIFVSFYTLDTKYENESKFLENSFKKNFLNYHIKGIESKGKWEHNCNMKPSFIKSMMNKFKKHDIVWIDADAEIKRFPSVFYDNEKYDFMCYRYRDREILSGLIFLKNNKKCRELIDTWIKITELNQDIWDQQNLQEALKTWNGKIKYLDDEYCKIVKGCGIDMEYVENPVIVQNQASRRLKSEINGY